MAKKVLATVGDDPTEMDTLISVTLGILRLLRPILMKLRLLRLSTILLQSYRGVLQACLRPLNLV